MGILDAPGLTRRIADATYMPSGGGLSTVTAAPIVFAHRFGGNYYPEDSLEGARAAFGLGPDALDTDAYLGADSSCPIMHDATVDRTTTGTGNTNDLGAGTTAQLLTKTTLVPGWGPCHIPNFGDVCREFGNRVVLSVESKVAGAALGLSRIAKRYRVDNDHLFWQSFTINECDVFVAEGWTNVCILSGDASVTPATCVSKGYKWIGVSSATGGASPSVIASYHAAGIKVGVYTVDRQADAAPWIAAGVDMIWSDDFAYVTDRQTVRTTDPFASKAVWPGQFIHATRTDFGAWTGTNEWGFSSLVNQTDAVGWGWATPKLKANADTVQIDLSLAFDSFSTGNTTNWMSLALLQGDATWLNGASYGGNGYSFYVRGDGRLRIYRIDGGVATQIQDTPTVGIPATGAFMSVRINLTPTTVRLTRTDVASAPAAFSDSTYRGLNYIQAVRSGALGRFKGVTLT